MKSNPVDKYMIKWESLVCSLFCGNWLCWFSQIAQKHWAGCCCDYIEKRRLFPVSPLHHACMSYGYRGVRPWFSDCIVSIPAIIDRHEWDSGGAGDESCWCLTSKRKQNVERKSKQPMKLKKNKKNNVNNMIERIVWSFKCIFIWS